MPIQTRTTYLPVYSTCEKYVYLHCPLCKSGILRAHPAIDPYTEVDDGYDVRATEVECNNKTCRSNTARIPPGMSAINIEARVYSGVSLVVSVTESHGAE